jgi:hypothetical protein
MQAAFTFHRLSWGQGQVRDDPGDDQLLAPACHVEVLVAPQASKLVKESHGSPVKFAAAIDCDVLYMNIAAKKICDNFIIKVEHHHYINTYDIM